MARDDNPAQRLVAAAAPLSAMDQAEGERLFARIVDFGRELYQHGFDVGPGRIAEAASGLPLIDLARPGDFYRFLTVCFVSRYEQQAVFAALYAAYWGAAAAGRGDPPEPPEHARTRGPTRPTRRPSPERAAPDDARHPTRPSEQRQRHPAARFSQVRRARDEDDEDAERQGTYSREELLRRKDFEEFSTAELTEAKALLAAMRWHLGERRTRRLRPARRGRSLDLRRTLRRSLRSAGEPLRLARRARARKPRPLVILCDISGSMSVYSRLLLHFAHTLASGLERVEAFVFATRLTRITRELARRDVDEAVRHVSESVRDWSGGTRIGESLRSFNRLWARRVLGNGAVVLIISDGWDRGDVAVLAAEMDRLHRNCHRLIWLNPLLGLDDYQPVTAGMRAALPSIDDFLPAHTLDSLVALGHLLEALDDRPRAAAPAVSAGTRGAPPAPSASRPPA